MLSKEYAYTYIRNEIKCHIYLSDIYLINLYMCIKSLKASKIKPPKKIYTDISEI